MLFKANTKLVLTGDSVTDFGRDRTGWPGTEPSLGTGYPRVISAELAAVYPELKILTINRGVSGDTTNELVARYQADVLDLHPDVVSILIGVNDVWRHFDSTFLHPTDLVDLPLYREHYQWLIDQSKAAGAQVLVMSPFFFEANHNDPMRQMVDEFTAAAKDLAATNDLLYIDIQARIDAYLKNNSPYLLTPDRVHPNYIGHTLVANEWLHAIGFDADHRQA
ncbi:SGNH/GDSL hydrolase family protein [Lacticaseibacillus yichunensis]|uniref:SGNH/GDSL hydrolase family protein n=1 Tax=Lacticaseibacillus yichunensis TaxID=2486015 RepID=A0ABW4CQJ2_9LACO|nr:SGNH/GDSL hydrolase family protein [Lacticaseibacillus yichunensis]